MLPYYKDILNNQSVYRCLRCRVDSFDERNIKAHCDHAHEKLLLPENDDPTQVWYASKQASNPLQGKKIALCLLTWNTAEASVHTARSIDREQSYLDALGIDAKVFWFDNGSSDGTAYAIGPEFLGHGLRFKLSSTNVGQCIARNWMIEEALSWGADYIFMVDGDVEVILLSTFALAQFIHMYSPPNCYPDIRKIGCVGLLSMNCTADATDNVAPQCRRIDLSIVDSMPDIAWTQYGMFSADVFHSGVRFDTNYPFDGPGWGFEDIDLYFSMRKCGFTSLNTPYFRYIHRHRHSSLPLLGTLAAKAFDERKKYILSKWSKDPDIGLLAQKCGTHRMPMVL